MTMGEDFVKDFAKRTRINYERFKQTEYNVTLLINSAVGMFIVPKEKYYKKLTDDKISEELLEKIKHGIRDNSYPENIDLQFIVRHIRNAISHGRLAFDSNKTETIKYVEFEDRKGKSACIIRLSVSLLEEFLLAFSDAVINL